MTRGTICSIALVAGLAVPAIADDRNPPPWRGEDNSVSAEYTNSSLSIGGPLDLVSFQWWDLTPGDGNDFNFDVPLTDPAIPTFDGLYHIYMIDMPNFYDDLPEKWMQVQLTWLSTGALQSPEVIVEGYEQGVPVLTYDDVIPSFLDVDYAVWDITLVPNPDWEMIHIRVPENMAITQVVIDTISIPAPGTLALASASFIATRRRR